MTRVFWKTEHIQIVTDGLVQMYPEVRQGNLDRVTAEDIEAVATKLLEPALFRKMAKTNFLYTKKRILDCIAAMPAVEPPPPSQAAPAEVAAPTEPTTPDAQEDEQRAARWGASEWVKLAEEVHRQNPYYGWPYKETLISLTQEELKAAQANVIPAERRKKFTNMHTTREYMIEAFQVVRKRLEEEKAEAERKLDMERQLSELRVEEERKKAEVALTLAAATAPTVEPLSIQIAKAATPMVQMLAKEFATAFVQALGPMISESLFEAMTRTSKAAKPAEQEPEPEKKPDIEDPHDVQPPTSYIGPEGIPPRPPKIGIIGPPHINQHLEGFADIDFIYIDRSTNIKDAIKSCAKIIGIDKFVNEAVRKALRNSDEAKGKFVPISGGASRVKHQINLWIQSGELKPTPRLQ